MNIKKIITGILSITMVTSVLAGCSKEQITKTNNENQTADTIKIGGLAPLSGNLAVYGVTTSNGYKLAVKEINEKGGLLGKKVELFLEDEEGDASKAINAYNKLKSKDIVGLIGDITSKPTISIARKTATEEIPTPMITPTATSADVTTYGNNIYRACYLDPFQGGSMAKYSKEKLGLKKVAILYDSSDDYSIGIAEAYKKVAEENGIKITNYETFTGGDSDFKSQLTKISANKPDGLFVPSYYNTIALIATQSHQVGLNDITFIGSDGWDGVLEALNEKDKNVVDGAVFANHYFTGDDEEVVKNFYTKYKAQFNQEPTAFSALGYDATMIMAKAIEKAGSTDKAEITKALSTLEYEGVTGNIKFNNSGDPVKSLTIITIKDGKYQLADKFSA